MCVNVGMAATRCYVACGPPACTWMPQLRASVRHNMGICLNINACLDHLLFLLEPCDLGWVILVEHASLNDSAALGAALVLPMVGRALLYHWRFLGTLHALGAVSRAAPTAHRILGAAAAAAVGAAWLTRAESVIPVSAVAHSGSCDVSLHTLAVGSTPAAMKITHAHGAGLVALALKWCVRHHLVEAAAITLGGVA